MNRFSTVAICALFALLCLNGCTGSSKINFDRIKIDMASLNKVLRGHIYRKVLVHDLSSLNEQAYLKFAKERAAESEAEYIKFLNTNPELKIRASKTDFVVCAKGRQLNKVLCDVARTAMTDFESDDLSIDLNKKITEFELSSQ